MRTKETVKKILAQKYLIHPVSIHQIRGGWSALAYIITENTGQQFLMKVYEKSRSSTHKLTAQTEYYMTLIEWLNVNTSLQGRIINPAGNIEGRFSCEDENYIFVLLHYIRGNDLAGRIISRKEIIELADIVAELHSYGSNIIPYTELFRETFENNFITSFKKLLRFINISDNELYTILHQYKDNLNIAIEQLEILSAKQKKRIHYFILCHTDIHEGNLLQTDNGLVLIDWENLKLAPAEADMFSLSKKSWFPVFFDRYRQKHPQYEIDPINLQFYSLRRKLEDIWEFIEQLLYDNLSKAERKDTLNYLLLECKNCSGTF